MRRNNYKINLSPEEYLSQYLAPSDTKACWEWLGARDKAGYGKSYRKYGTHMAHRLSYQTFVGPIPNAIKVLHRCDNRSCCNPTHLFLGTQKDNMNDMARKGRARNGAMAKKGL